MTKNDAPARKPGVWKRMCRTFNPDAMFAILGGFLAFSVAKDIFTPADGEGSGVAILVGVTLVTTILVSIGSRFDKRMLEDFHYRLMSQAALVSMTATLVVFGIYQIFDDALPTLETAQLVTVLMAGWIVGYFYHRWRGLDV